MSTTYSAISIIHSITVYATVVRHRLLVLCEPCRDRGEEVRYRNRLRAKPLDCRTQASKASIRLKEISSTTQCFNVVLVPPLEFFAGGHGKLPIGLAGAIVDREEALDCTKEVDRADLVHGLH